jgi:HEPN domain-containing protein
MPNRERDWLAQAKRNLDQARSSRGEGRHEWACFAAQQAAGIAVKALHLHLGQQAMGARRRQAADRSAANAAGRSRRARQGARQLLHAPRYPNGHPEGAPFEHYGILQSEEATTHAGAILEFVRSRLA